MARKCKCPDGIPEWIVTYGDLMSLLLTFFILLAAFSELKKEEQYQDVIRAIQDHFGYLGGVGTTPADDPPTASVTNLLDAAHLESKEFLNPSATEEPGVIGRQTTVKRIREGELFTIGGLIAFDKASAILRDEAKQAIRQAVLKELIGKNNKVEIRGHATNGDLPGGSPYRSLTEISFARAVAVQQFLIAENIRPERIRVVASSNHEPLIEPAYDDASAAANRRVELIQHEALVDDFKGDEPAEAPLN